MSTNATFAEDLRQALNDWSKATPAQRLEAVRIAAEAAAVELVEVRQGESGPEFWLVRVVKL